MDLVVALEERFARTPDGAYRTATSYPRAFWDRYLSVFDRVRIACRVLDVPADRSHQRRVDGDRVSVLPLPCYVGPRQYLLMRAAVVRAIRAIDFADSAVLLRVPGVVGSLISRTLPSARPYGVEVCGDPFDVFAPGSIDHPLRPFFRWWFSRELARVCRGAACSLYVTQRALQQRYPPPVPTRRSTAITVGVSDVEMPDEAYRPFAPSVSRSGSLRIISVGTLEQMYKGQDLLLKAVARCLAAGLDTRLTLVGTGRLMPVLQKLARELGTADRVTFTGALPSGAAIRAALDEHELFVLASRQEGLPRAMVEAMARGLPCIGTMVGGIPELLPEYALVRPGDVRALTERIVAFGREPKLRERASRENLAAARRYHESVLQPVRENFYRELASVTSAWSRGRRGRAPPSEASASTFFRRALR